MTSVKDVPRGRPILLTSEEWHQRSASLYRSDLPRSLFYNALACIPVTVILTLFIWDLSWVFLIPIFLLHWVAWSGVDCLREGYHSRREVARQNHSGLFEYGIQQRLSEFDMTFFIPYAEIERAWVKEGRRGMSLQMDLRGQEQPYASHDLLKILGEEGLEELQRRVGGRLPVQEPPKLVLYGDRPPVITSVSPLVASDVRSPVFSPGIQF